MITQFENLSSWRKEEITIEPHELYTLNYRDTMPNIFVIVNPNECNLKVGITNLPRVDSYEFKVDYNSTETVGRPIGTNNLYILNDSSAKAKIIVFSIEKDFDPQILKNMNVSMQGYTMETSTVIQGFKEGIYLPVSDAAILDSIANLKSVHMGNLQTAVNALLKETTFSGKADSMITALGKLLKESTFTGKADSILTKLDTLISGQGSGGGGEGSSYDDTALKALITEVKTLIAAQDVTENDALLTLIKNSLLVIESNLGTVKTDVSNVKGNLAKIANYLKPSGTPVYLNNATSFSYTASAACTLHFGWLFNDGGTTATLKKGSTELLTIMADERLTDFEIELAAGDVLTLDSTAPMYRIKYWTY